MSVQRLSLGLAQPRPVGSQDGRWGMESLQGPQKRILPGDLTYCLVRCGGGGCLSSKPRTRPHWNHAVQALLVSFRIVSFS